MITDNLNKKDTTRQIALKTLWLAENHGILVKLAGNLGCTKQLVGMVFWRKRRSQRVEEALAEVHAPGFTPSLLLKTGTEA
jgi:hypothetical protein